MMNTIKLNTKYYNFGKVGKGKKWHIFDALMIDYPFPIDTLCGIGPINYDNMAWANLPKAKSTVCKKCLKEWKDIYGTQFYREPPF